MPDEVPRRHRCGFETVEDAALRGQHLDRPERAGVVRDLWGQRRLHGERRVGPCVVQHHVDAVRRLRGRAGIVDCHPVTANRHQDAKGQVLLAEPIRAHLGRILPIGKGGKRSTQRLLRPRHDLGRHRVDAVEVELLHEPQKAARAHLVARHLGIDVAHRLVRGPNIGPDQSLQRPVGPAPAQQLEDREPQPLLEDLGRRGGQYPAADVGRMAAAGKPGHQPPVAKDRCGHGDVVDLSRRHPWVVRDEHVTVDELLGWERRDDVLHARSHRVDVARRTAG